MLDAVFAHVELIQRNNIFRIVIADVIIRSELAPDSLIGRQQIGNLFSVFVGKNRKKGLGG